MEESNEKRIMEEAKVVIKDKDIKIYLIVIGILTLILWYYQPIMAILFTILFGYLIFDSIKNTRDKKKEFEKYIEGLADEFDSATRHAIFNMPFPLVILGQDSRITWYNTPFLNLVGEDEKLGEHIADIVPNIKNVDMFEEDNKYIDIKFKEKNYKIYPNFVDTKKTKNINDQIVMLYFVDDTKFENLKNKYIDEKPIVSFVYVDNYSDVRDSTPEVQKPMVMAEIDKNINSYFTERGGIVRKYENDKYLVIYNNQVFKSFEDKKFDILDNFREMNIGNTIPITLSMGISSEGRSLTHSYQEAKAAIDVALGRGGDQVVVQDGNKLDFYGGKSKAIEKRNKVKSRVIGYALRQLIDQSDKVFVMGHQNPDMDSYGAGIGILSAIKARDKMGYLVLNDINPSIKNIHEVMKEVQPELQKNIVTTEEALEEITDNSLLVVVDNHKPSFTEAPILLEKIEKVVLIDHHRRGAEFIDNPVLVYLEPYASSTCELVTEVLTYMGDNLNLTKFEAEALLAGITVDTKNFSFQTGVRTFEAASTLKRAGADSTTVSRFFRDDINTFVYKAEVIKSAKVISDIIAIGKLERDMDNSILVAAQSADELLNVSGIEASFVLTQTDDRIHISGRSLGNVSVQIILEKLGGGGHLTSAGAQVEMNMEEAEKILVEKIDEYLQEGED